MIVIVVFDDDRTEDQQRRQAACKPGRCWPGLRWDEQIAGLPPASLLYTMFCCRLPCQCLERLIPTSGFAFLESCKQTKTNSDPTASSDRITCMRSLLCGRHGTVPARVRLVLLSFRPAPARCRYMTARLAGRRKRVELLTMHKSTWALTRCCCRPRARARASALSALSAL